MALKHHVTVKSIFGENIERDLYFRLTKAELMELNEKYADEGGFDGRLKRLGEGANGKLILETLKDFLGRAYGERRGDELVKSDEIRDAFFASEAYSKVFEDLAAGDLNPYEFVRQTLPEGAELDNPEKTASEVARERSEAKLQGHQQKETPAPQPETVILAEPAPPVLEPQSEPTPEQLRAAWEKQQNQQ